MMRPCLALAALLLATVPLQAKLEIQNIQMRYGYLGPERRAVDFYPHDEVFFRFRATGLKLDKDGQPKAEMSVSLTDAKGKEMLPTAAEKYPLAGTTDLGGDSTFGFATVRLDEKVAPGEFTLTVTVKDLLSKEEASFRRKLNYKKPEFAVVTPRFFYDPEGTTPAPIGGFLGQRLFYGFYVIGFEGTADKAKVDVKLEILDAKGKAVLSKPLPPVPLPKDLDPKLMPRFLTYVGDLALFREGDYTLRLTATEKMKVARFEAPLRIAGP
jgi:hypothetical protein